MDRRQTMKNLILLIALFTIIINLSGCKKEDLLNGMDSGKTSKSVSDSKKTFIPDGDFENTLFKLVGDDVYMKRAGFTYSEYKEKWLNVILLMNKTMHFGDKELFITREDITFNGVVHTIPENEKIIKGEFLESIGDKIYLLVKLENGQCQDYRATEEYDSLVKYGPERSCYSEESLYKDDSVFFSNYRDPDSKGLADL